MQGRTGRPPPSAAKPTLALREEVLGGQCYGGPMLWGALWLLKDPMLRRGSGCAAVTPGVALAPSSRGSATQSCSRLRLLRRQLWSLRAPVLDHRGLWPLQGGHMSHGARNCRQLELWARGVGWRRGSVGLGGRGNVLEASASAGNPAEGPGAAKGPHAGNR